MVEKRQVGISVHQMGSVFKKKRGFTLYFKSVWKTTSCPRCEVEMGEERKEAESNGLKICGKGYGQECRWLDVASDSSDKG